jgi:hypothetical protein
MSNVKSFIDELKQLSNNDCFNVYVPSLDKEIKFRAFSVKQHKDLMKSALDGVEGTLKMYKIFNDIILSNSLDPVDFTLYDRTKILVDLRKQCISEIVDISDIKYNLNDLPVFNFSFDKEQTFKYKKITVEVSLPSLEIDSNITEKSVLEFSKYSTEDKKIGNSLSILLVYELMKFINTLTIEDTVINFNEINTTDKKAIIDNLPLKLINDILDYIARFKDYEQALFTFSDGTKLTIDASFLSTE